MIEGPNAPLVSLVTPASSEPISASDALSEAAIDAPKGKRKAAAKKAPAKKKAAAEGDAPKAKKPAKKKAVASA